MDQHRPNLLIIMADQMSALALPFYGYQIVQVPNLESLAQSGVLFENAYCNSPLCAPSRASVVNGQLPSCIGTNDNAAEFPASVPTFGLYLRAKGYSTCRWGKMHFIGPDQLHRFEEQLTTDIYPADLCWTPDWEHPEHRPSWYHNILSVVQAGTCLTPNQLALDEEVAFHATRRIHEMAREGGDRPFCLFVSFTHLHDPVAITQEYWDRYDHDEIDLPAVPPFLIDQLDPHGRRLVHVCDVGRYLQTEERVRKARHAYHGAVSYVDDKVGRLVRALEAAGLLDNIVVFTSDHEEMLGERGLWYKMNFFEWSTRVPVIFYSPGRFTARRVESQVSLVDLLPTLVELGAGDGGTPALSNAADGKSLEALLQGDGPGWPDTVAGEILCEGTIAPCITIRRSRYKYVYIGPDPEQLYDLAADPDELESVAGRPEFEQVRQELYDAVKSRWDPQAIYQDVIASQRRRKLVSRSLSAGKQTSRDFQPIQDGSQQ